MKKLFILITCLLFLHSSYTLDITKKLARMIKRSILKLKKTIDNNPHYPYAIGTIIGTSIGCCCPYQVACCTKAVSSTSVVYCEALKHPTRSEEKKYLIDNAKNVALE